MHACIPHVGMIARKESQVLTIPSGLAVQRLRARQVSIRAISHGPIVHIFCIAVLALHAYFITILLTH